MLVFRYLFEVFTADLCAAFIGMLVNFYLQKKFVFDLKRKQSAALLLSIGSSVVVMLLGAALLSYLSDLELFTGLLVIAKLISMGFKFVLNFITKRWVFEKTWK